MNRRHSQTQQPPVVHIRPAEGLFSLRPAELWSYRELLYFLTWRDIKVRYKQSLVGVAWTILQPLTMMLVFSLFFGKLASMPSEGIPYPLFALAGILPWQVFSRTLSESTNSLVTDQRLITRVYFPRILVPAATAFAAMVDFGISLLVFALFMALWGVLPTGAILLLPALSVLMLLTALGVGFWLSALNVEYRDVMYAVPFLTQVWLFVTPVVYPSGLVPEAYQVFYGLNPMVGVIEGFRWCLLGVGRGLSPMVLVSGLVSLAVFLSGALWFRRRERIFIDSLG